MTVQPYALVAVEATLLDYFAAQALAGDAANNSGSGDEWPTPEQLAQNCYRIADAMLAERIRRDELA